MGSPTGAGVCLTISLSTVATPMPVLALTLSTSDSAQPMMPASSAAYLSGLALGRSILLSTGITWRSAANAR